MQVTGVGQSPLSDLPDVRRLESLGSLDDLELHLSPSASDRNPSATMAV